MGDGDLNNWTSGDISRWLDARRTEVTAGERSTDRIEANLRSTSAPAPDVEGRSTANGASAPMTSGPMSGPRRFLLQPPNQPQADASADRGPTPVAPALRILTWNVARLSLRRRVELAVCFSDLGPDERPHVAVFTEAHLFRHELKDVSLEGYALFGSLPSGGTRRGGIIIAVRRAIVAHVAVQAGGGTLNPGDSDVLAVDIVGATPQLRVVGFYRTPGSSAAQNADLFDALGAEALAGEEANISVFFAGDMNVHSVVPPWQVSGPFRRRHGDHPRHGLHDAVVGVLRGDHGGHARLTVVSNSGDASGHPTWTRKPTGDQSGLPHEVDYIFASRTASLLVMDSAVATVADSPFAGVKTDHRPILLRIKAVVGPARPPQTLKPPTCRHRARWASANETAQSAFAVAFAAGAGPLLRSWNADVADETPFRSARGSPDAAVGALMAVIRKTEVSTIGATQSGAVRPGRLHVDAAWWTSDVAAGHGVATSCTRSLAAFEEEAASRNARPSGVAFDAAVAAAAAAEAQFAKAAREGQALAAHERLLCVRPGGHEARRLYAMIRALVLCEGQAPPHVFEAVLAADGSILCEDEDVEGELVRWMEKRHEEVADDPAFDSAFFADLERKHTHWARRLCDAESAVSRRCASDDSRWRRFAATIDAALRVGSAAGVVDVAQFSAYIASNFGELETIEALKKGSSSTASSPADDVGYAPLKHGGAAMVRAVRLFGSMVLASGRMPASMTCGFVTWLLKKGSPLILDNFRGVVCTSCFGKVIEAVVLERLLRWARTIGAVSTLQATTSMTGGTLEQTSSLLDVLALRRARGRCTWTGIVDIKGAFPSVSHHVLWWRLYYLGLRGAALRFIVNLVVNDARLGGLPGGGVSCRVRRAVGVPEGFRCSPFLFAIVFSPLLEVLEASGAGVRVSDVFVGALMLADDVVLIADSADDLRILFKTMMDWTYAHRFRVHDGKTKVAVLGPRADAAIAAADGAFIVEHHGVRRRFAAETRAVYLGTVFDKSLRGDAAIAVWRGRSTLYLKGARAAMGVVGSLSRSTVLGCHVGLARSALEWASPVWARVSTKVLEGLDRLEMATYRLVLGVDAASGISHLGAALLLGDVPAQLRRLRDSARFARRAELHCIAAPHRRALTSALLATSGAEDFSSLRNGRTACSELGLTWPPAAATGARDWKKSVNEAVLRRLWEDAANMSSLRLLVAARPPLSWFERFIRSRPIADDDSAFLIRIFGGRWRLLPDMRGRFMRPRRASGHCDLCSGAHAGGDDAAVFLLCPFLASPRAAWFSGGRAAARREGLAGWWRDTVETPVAQGRPSHAALAAAILGSGATHLPVGGRERLRDALTRNFCSTVGAWARANDDAIRALPPARRMPDTVVLGPVPGI